LQRDDVLERGLLIGGRSVPASAGKLADDVSSCDGGIYARVGAGTPQDVTRAVDPAQATFPAWSKLEALERRENPLLILEDADPDLAVDAAVFGAFMNSGQICMSTDGIIIHESLLDAFMLRYVERVEALTVGDPADPTTRRSSKTARSEPLAAGKGRGEDLADQARTDLPLAGIDGGGADRREQLAGPGLWTRHVAHLDATVIVVSDCLGHQPVTFRRWVGLL
jgi:Aldehyde dehydrogenase family